MQLLFRKKYYKIWFSESRNDYGSNLELFKNQLKKSLLSDASNKILINTRVCMILHLRGISQNNLLLEGPNAFDSIY